jgi:hypothetical protein
MRAFKSGVLNSNLSEGHILKKKFSAGHSLLDKNFCGTQLTRKALKINKIWSKFLILSSFGMFEACESQAARMHLAGRLRPEVFEIPALNDQNFNDVILGLHQQLSVNIFFTEEANWNSGKLTKPCRRWKAAKLKAN